MRSKPVVRTRLGLLAILGISGAVNLMRSHTSAVMAVRAGRLFDPVSGHLLADQVAIVKGERIADVGPSSSLQVPLDAKIIDLSRATVLPGLIDTPPSRVFFHQSLFQEETREP